eukprot:347040_1
MSSCRKLAQTILLFCCITHISGALEEWLTEFDHWTDLHDPDCTLYWTSHTDECYIEFGIEVKTSGWAGLGISASGNMYPADIIIGWVDDETGDVYLHNYYTVGLSSPILFNDQSGITLIDGWQQEVDGISTTYLRFEKELFPSQYRQSAVDISIGTTRVIYAFNQNDPNENDPRALQQHLFTDRGPKSLNLLSGETQAVELPDDVHYIDILQPNVEIPNTDTTYLCTLLELPPFSNTEHIIRIDPVVQEGNEGLVHHILLYTCPERYVDLDYLNTGWNCDDAPNMATNVTHCRQGSVMYAWAVGGGYFYFPEDVGMEIGGGHEYVLLETHFDNPSEESGHIDESGLRLWITPTLRNHNAGIIQIGDMLDQVIPPGISSLLNYGWLSSGCSTVGLPEEGVHIFANFYHQHLLGRAGIIRHIRNGIELEPIEVNEAYDFDFQQYVPLKQERLLLPGDEIIVECEIDSSQVDVMTYGGEATKDEMCVTFFAVYPKPEIAIAMTMFIPNDKDQFYEDAHNNGYWNIEKDIYDVSVDGALEFYNDFNTNPNTERIQICNDEYTDSLLPEGDDIITPIWDYIPHKMVNHFGCIQSAASDSGFEWDSWYAYLGGVIIGLFIISLVIYLLYKCMVSKKRNKSNYGQLVEVGNKTMGNEESMYGATHE